jgi:hypothetical protein
MWKEVVVTCLEFLSRYWPRYAVKSHEMLQSELASFRGTRCTHAYYENSVPSLVKLKMIMAIETG